MAEPTCVDAICPLDEDFMPVESAPIVPPEAPIALAWPAGGLTEFCPL